LVVSADPRALGDAESANVVGEIVGREKPEEIVLLGGHLDSWDVGTGASDDGVGCIVTWDALRLMVKLGIRPRRTVRVVLWTNEENGLRGAAAYAEKYGASAADHVFALESDLGVFAPAALGFSGSLAARAVMAQIASLLGPLELSEMTAGGGGADIGPIAQAGRVPTMAYLGDAGRYFVVHHTAADTVDRILPEEVSRASAAIAVVAYAVAEMPESWRNRYLRPLRGGVLGASSRVGRIRTVRQPPSTRPQPQVQFCCSVSGCSPYRGVADRVPGDASASSNHPATVRLPAA
jgi:carboxypeptidase Q